VIAGTNRPLAAQVAESLATALALGAALVFFGACLVGSFHPHRLARPYWPDIGGLRTDTSGEVAFAALVVALAVSETLRVYRRRGADGRAGSRQPLSSAASLATGVAAAVLVTSIGLVVYLSVNAVTHPATLAMQSTHFARWPTEGTLRVLALMAAVLAAAWLRLVVILHPGAWIGS
jgi:hypothetical protein